MRMLGQNFGLFLKRVIFFSQLFERQILAPADPDFIVATLEERNWRSLQYADSAVHPLLVVHEIARRVGREKHKICCTSYSTKAEHLSRRPVEILFLGHR